MYERQQRCRHVVDIDTVDDQANAMWADGRYMEKLTSAAGLFQSGVGGQSTFRRVG